MLNEQVKNRLNNINIKGSELIEMFEGLVEVAIDTQASDATMILGYNDKDIKCGEFIAELILTVKQIPKNEI